MNKNTYKQETPQHFIVEGSDIGYYPMWGSG